MSRQIGLTNDQIAMLIGKIAEKHCDQLDEQTLLIDFDRRHGCLYEVHGSDAIVRLKFSLSPSHPRFREVLDRAISSAISVRRGESLAEGHRMLR